MSFKKALTIALALAFPLTFAVPAVIAADKATTFKVDPAASNVKWLAKKVTGQHHGTVPVKSGELTATNGALTGGTIVIDTAKLEVVDLTGDSKGNLTGHLNSPDFFDTAKYPTSTFKITSVKKLEKPTARGDNAEITGDLTIKDKTNPLTFPASVVVHADKIVAEAVGVTVDRTLYDIRYGSGKFFQGIGDKAINDEFWIDFNIVATK